MFNTLDAVRRIEAAGVGRPTAEAIVDEIAASRDDLFTKADAAVLGTRLKSNFEAKLEAAKSQLILSMLGIVGFADGLLFFALRR